MQKTSIKVGHRNNPKELEAIFSLALVGGALVGIGLRGHRPPWA
jgi:hypothetical protein